MAAGRFRPLVAIAAGGCLIISLLSVYTLFSSYSRYRGRDFNTVTKTRDMSLLATRDGTCVGTPTKEMLGSVWSCENADGKKKTGNLLMASVHGLYYASQRVDADPDLVMASERVVSAVLGGTSSPGLNKTTLDRAYEALKEVSVPTTCYAIYGASAVYDAGMTSTLPKSPTVICDGETAGSLSSTVTVNTNQLYTHCLMQHSFARSGPDDGTYGLPLVGGSAPGPLWYPWANVTGFNETSPWGVKSRMFVGMRFSWSLSAYVTGGLTTGFMLVDAACLLLAELTWPARAQASKNAVSEQGANLDSSSRVSKAAITLGRLAATHNGKRARRAILAGILVSVQAIFYSVLIWSTFGTASRMQRPICETPGSEVSLNYDWKVLGGGNRPRGGFQSDWNATILEMANLFANIFCLFALPISESLPAIGLRGGNIPANNKLIGRNTKASTDARSLYTALLQVFVLVGGVTCIALGNAFVSNAFNNAWGRAVAGVAGLGWDEIMVSEYMFDQGSAFILAMMTAGFVSAAVQARWLINGLSCDTALVFFAWVIFSLGGLLPMIIVFSMDYFTDNQKAVEECEIFQIGGTQFEKNVCDYKRGFMIAALVTFAAVLIFQTVMGLLAYFPELCRSSTVAEANTNQIAGSSAAPLGGGGYISKDEHFFNFATSLSSTANDPEVSARLLRPVSPTMHDGSFGTLPIRPTEARRTGDRFTFTALDFRDGKVGSS